MDAIQQGDILSYYNQLASQYDTSRFGNSYGQFLHQQELKFLSEVLPKNCENTLDLGCGTGRFLSLAEHGIDISPEMIREARKKFPHKKLSVSDSSHTQYGDAVFHCVFSMHVFMHLNKEKMTSVLAEAYRILKPNGQFIFDFPSAKRRGVLKRVAAGWHGANSFSISELQKLTMSQWKIKYYRGLLFLPVHRLPRFIRKYFIAMDTWLCGSLIKDYASYLIVILEKR
jgi:ubiquinone/menaquinone biosynthesis C-methylase UbiE